MLSSQPLDFTYEWMLFVIIIFFNILLIILANIILLIRRFSNFWYIRQCSAFWKCWLKIEFHNIESITAAPGKSGDRSLTTHSTTYNFCHFSSGWCYLLFCFWFFFLLISLANIFYILEYSITFSYLRCRIINFLVWVSLGVFRI